MDNIASGAVGQREAWVRRLLPRRFNIQLLLLSAILILANLAGVMSYIVSEFVGIRRADTQAQIHAVAQNLALGAAPLILTRDYGSIEQLLESAADYPGVRSLTLVDRQHRILGRVLRAPGGTARAVYGEGVLTPPQGGGSRAAWIYAPDNFGPGLPKDLRAASLVLWHPIDRGKLGWLRMEVSTTDIPAQATRLIVNSGLFLRLFVVLDTALLYALIRPTLNALVRATRFVQGLGDVSGQQMRVSTANVEIETLGRTLNRTSARLQAQEDALKASQIQIAAVVENLADGIITIDANGTVLMVNSALCRLLGYAREELVGGNVSSLMPEPYRTAHDGYLDRYLETGQARIIGFGREVTAQHRDGSIVPVQLAVNQYRIGEQRYFVGVMHDLRGHKRLIGELQQARDAALEASRAKSDFLAAMSHEIRTPLNGVIGMLDLLRQTSLDGQQAKMAEIIHDSAHTLLNIINDILDLSKIEAGKLEFAPEPFCVEDMVEAVCMLEQPVAMKKGVELTLFVDPRIPRLASGDALRIRQVLTNLVNNAIKFSSGLERAAQVALRIQLMMEEDGRVWVECIVRDNGIGMSAATQNKLFQPFEQADANTTKRYGGTGLGLAICHRLTSMMGGRISVISAPDRGSAFTVILPLGKLEQAPEPPSPVAGLSCLVIGPQAGMAADIALHLQQAGADVLRAPDLDALRAFPKPLPALWVWVLEFTGVPDLANMRDAAHQIHGADLNFLLVQHLSINRGRRLKPRRLAHDVVQVDGNLLTRRRILEAVAVAAGRAVAEELPTIQAQRGRAVQAPSREEAQRQGRLILVAEDNEVNQLVIRSQLEIIGLAADLVPNGQLALERWASGQYGLVLSDLHMPVMDCYQFAAAVREQEARRILARTPIVALSAAAQRGEAERCRAAGIDDYLSKPVSIERLKETLEKWLPPVQSETQVRSGEPAQGGSRAANVHLDLDVLKALVGDDADLIATLLQEFRLRSVPTADALVSGFAEGRLEDVGFHAHKLKSSARSVGALALGEACRQLEAAGKSGDREKAAALLPGFEDELDAVLEAVDRCMADLAMKGKEGNTR